MASDLLSIAASNAAAQKDLGQKYLDLYQSRKDSFDEQLKQDIASARAQTDTVSFSSNSLINKATQLVADLESIDKETGPIFKAASNITEIITSYEQALEKFGAVESDEDVRAVLDDLLQSLEPSSDSPDAPAPTLSGDTLAVDEEV